MYNEKNGQQSGTEVNGGLWNRLNSVYRTNEKTEAFHADYYWPTKNNMLEENDLVVEIIGGKVNTEGEQPRLLFYLRLPDKNQTAIKSYRLVPECMRFLRKDMENLEIFVDDIRKIGSAVKQLLNRRIKARLYYNNKTGWQDLDFVGIISQNTAEECSQIDEENTFDDEDIFS
mgnify:CR=1 FL=1